MILTQCEAAIILSMARAANSEGFLQQRGGAIQHLAAKTIFWLRKQGWANEELYVRDAGLMLAWKREAKEEEIESALVELRQDLENWDLTSA